MSIFWRQYTCTQAQQKVWKDRGNTTGINRRQNKEVKVFVRRNYSAVTAKCTSQQ